LSVQEAVIAKMEFVREGVGLFLSLMIVKTDMNVVPAPESVIIMIS
jgi:hypothetical protein